MKKPELEIGDTIDVQPDRLSYGGEAVARHNGLAVFIPNAAPGDMLRIRITERKKNFARAVIDRVLEASPSRREPPCQYFGVCGGCQLQHLKYDAQLEAKVGFVRDALERIARFDWPHPIEIRHRGEFGYRSRAQVKVDRQTGSIGFNRAHSNAVCDVAACPVLVPALDDALRTLRGSPVARAGSTSKFSRVLRFEMAAGDSSVSFEPAAEGLPGGTVEQSVNDAVYSFTPSAFFQANTGLLGELVNEAVGESYGELAIDLYAGVGLFSVPLAKRFGQVIAVESDLKAVKLARENMKVNQRDNVEFHQSKVDVWFKRFMAANPAAPDLVLLDPPRIGAAEAMPFLTALKPSRITYVSCDPATLARDVRTLLDSGFDVAGITSIDLFPQTYHVETVVRLDRR